MVKIITTAFMGPPNVYFGLEGILARQVPIPKKSQAEIAVVLSIMVLKMDEKWPCLPWKARFLNSRRHSNCRRNRFFQGKEFCSIGESILITLSSTGTSVTSVSANAVALRGERSIKAISPKMLSSGTVSSTRLPRRI
jgi:hypothetical protein